MKAMRLAAAAAAAVLVSAAAGYRIGVGSWPSLNGRAELSSPPEKAANGRDHAQVHDDQGEGIAGASSKPSASGAASADRKLIYYRNPMGLPDTSPTPKKDWMGMDYIAVFEGEESDASTVKVSLDRVQRAGVRSEEARLVKLSLPIRAPGIAKVDERTMREITLRADGFIEKLYANEHGKHVKAGEPLFRIYSRDILRALIDDRSIIREPGARASVLTSDQKLRALDIPQKVIDEARAAKDTPMSFDWPSPVSGVIMEKKAVEGQMAKMGEMLFMIGDLAKIWVIADVPEQETGRVKIGDSANITFRALPGETFEGKVTFILHELDHATRTGKVRIEVANPEHRVRHEMYAEVEIESGSGDALRLAVPTSAVIDSGNRQVVLLDRGDGRFEPRPVKLGERGAGMVEIAEGVKAGDKVVVTANFLIDAESNLKAALSSFSASGAADQPAAGQEMAR